MSLVLPSTTEEGPGLCGKRPSPVGADYSTGHTPHFESRQVPGTPGLSVNEFITIAADGLDIMVRMSGHYQPGVKKHRPAGV